MATPLLFADEKLVLLLERQNETAFSYLYDKYSPLVYGVVLRATKDESIAAEILRLTFIKIARECKEIKCLKRPLFSWVLAITQNTANDCFSINIDWKSLLKAEKQEILLPKEKIEYHKEFNSSSYFNYNSPS